MALTPAAAQKALIAFQRFGLGAKPGGPARIGANPLAALRAEVEKPDIGKINNPALPAYGKACFESQMGFGRAEDVRRMELNARIDKQRSVEIGFVERLVMFWSNHFSMTVNKSEAVRGTMGQWERNVIRANVLGRFSDMLQGTLAHPAMISYLDNVESIGPNSVIGKRWGVGYNENLAREAMELHSLGSGGGYSEDDVTAFAKILTGWSYVRGWESDHNENGGNKTNRGQFIYRANWHEPGPVKLMGKTYTALGQKQAENALDDLAVHPATAEHIAFKLVRHFITDEPTSAMVDPIKQRFLQTGGHLKAVSLALLDLPAAWSTPLVKLRTPYENTIAQYRALGVRYKNNETWAFSEPLRALDHMPWESPSPEGFSDDTLTWLNPDSTRIRLDVAQFTGWAFAPNSKRNVQNLAHSIFDAALSPLTRDRLGGIGDSNNALTILFFLPRIPAEVMAVKDNHCDCSAGADALHAAEGCAESRLLMSRRAMLGVTAGLFSWAYMPRFAEAATNGARLLVVVLRGGMDGINTVVPFGDSHYVSMRGGIAIPAASTIRLNSFFGLNPALRNFGNLYKAGDAAVVHATCVPLRNRSHFDGQDNLENGLPGMGAANQTGWLNRLLTALPTGSPIKVAGAIQIGEAPLILRGPAPVLGWSPTWFSPVKDPTLYMLRTLYRDRDAEMYKTLERGLKAHRLASRIDKEDGNISSLRKGFRGAGRLIAAADGPRIAVLSVGGWDTHSNQGGQLSGVLADLDLAIADFKTAVGAAVWKSTAVVMATEFGRTVRVNGDSGTDHGVGTVALLAGGAVNGGKVFGNWPGLAPNQLYEQSDLRPTTDLRSVFKGILRDHIGVGTNLLNTSIFPESAAAPPMADLIQGSNNDAAPVVSSAAPVRVTSEPAIAKYRRARRSA